jgi:predicted Fe-Mo cluster-binding NifX family protein
MKIAVPTQNGQVNDHFGHSENYSVYTISPENTIVGHEVVTSGQGCGCKSGIAATLFHKGVTLMLAGNIGGGAIHHLNNYGITVVRGCYGPAEDVVKTYLMGGIQDSGEICNHHEGCHHSEN